MNNSTKLALELSKLDNVTLALVIISVLEGKKDSILFKDISKVLNSRIEQIKPKFNSDQGELF